METVIPIKRHYRKLFEQEFFIEAHRPYNSSSNGNYNLDQNLIDL
ncbi:4297_t:CDS:2 [Rhizophagus irregularis]|nr:4297_t:CDS:2 [Rhizophagus irregularis]